MAENQRSRVLPLTVVYGSLTLLFVILSLCGVSLKQVLEAAMVSCFGASWPFSFKRIRDTKSAKGVSLAFLMLVETGYVLGLVGKLAQPDWVIAVYILNLASVGVTLWVALRYATKKDWKKSMVPLWGTIGVAVLITHLMVTSAQGEGWYACFHGAMVWAFMIGWPSAVVTTVTSKAVDAKSTEFLVLILSGYLIGLARVGLFDLGMGVALPTALNCALVVIDLALVLYYRDVLWDLFALPHRVEGYPLPERGKWTLEFALFSVYVFFALSITPVFYVLCSVLKYGGLTLHNVATVLAYYALYIAPVAITLHLVWKYTAPQSAPDQNR